MLLLCFGLHIVTLALLAVRHSQQLSTAQSHTHRRPAIPSGLIKIIGTLAFVLTLLLPYQYTHLDGLSQCQIRVACFFYGCKMLDLALCKSETPPRIIKVERTTPQKLESLFDHVKYMWLLLAEMRYGSFDIAVHQKGRSSETEQDRQISTSFAALVFLGAVNYLYPLAELKCICLLLILQVAFEGLHAVVHPNCRRPLFYRPFSASSMGDFWATHWHACAAPFLYSLGYKPGRRLTGQWLGVLATFNISGLWHGWSAAGLVDDQYYATVLGSQVWALFMLFGVICLAERIVWRDKQGGMIQRIIVWVLPVLAAGQCLRTLERYTTIPWLRI